MTNLAAVLNRMGRSTEAAEVLNVPLPCGRTMRVFLGVLSAILASNGDYVGAEEVAHRAVQLHNSDADAWVQLGNISIDVGEVDAAAEAYGRGGGTGAAVTGLPAHNRLYALHLSATIGDDGLFGRPPGIGGRGSLMEASGLTGAAIRIGGCGSGTFRRTVARHPVGWFMAPVLPNRRIPAQVEVICYSDREVEDELTRFLRNHCQSWTPTSGMERAGARGTYPRR